MKCTRKQVLIGVSLVSILLVLGGTREKEYKIVPEVEAANTAVSSTQVNIPAAEVKGNNSALPAMPAILMAAGGCESNDSPHKKPRQFDKNGKVIKHLNKNGSIDYGAFQINSIHLKEAAALGLDFINSEADNYKMALILYRRHGVGIWFGFDAKTWNCSYYTKANVAPKPLQVVSTTPSTSEAVR